MATLEQAFNHIVLPPEIPGKEDDDLDSIGNDLVRRLRRACSELKTTTGSDYQQGWELLDDVLKSTQQAIGGPLTKSIMYTVISQVAKENGFAVIHLKEQNAGLIMYRIEGEKSEVVFEAFESAPRLQEITTARDVLNWDFPSRAVKISSADFCSNSFVESFAMFIEKADLESLDHLAEKIKKAGVSVTEMRDVVKPDLITHMLLSLLQSMGGIAKVDVIHKRVRDDANLNGGTIPWRRLPLWLVLRVAAQRYLNLRHGQLVGYVTYKILSCMVLSHLLQDCTKKRFPIALVTILHKKLGRKMAKLETYVTSHLEQSEITAGEVTIGRRLIYSVANTFTASMNSALEYVQRNLASFKSTSIRAIPTLPRRANESDLILSLPSSGSHLDSLLRPIHNRHGSWAASSEYSGGLPGNPSDLPAVRNTAKFIKGVVDIVELVVESKNSCAGLRKNGLLGIDTQQAIGICSSLKSTATNLAKMVRPYQIDNVELNSAVILEAFDNWAIMDAIVVSHFPLLGEYCPIFPSELLDILQLPDLASILRLRAIQKHLSRRHETSMFPTKTIFADFDVNSFATRYSQSSGTLQELRKKLASADDLCAEQKANELERMCEEFDEKTREINALECSCSWRGGQRQVQGCVRCYKWRVRKRMKINTYEHTLPSDNAVANAMVFELGTPELLSIYIQTTWSLVTQLAYPRLPTAGKKVYKLLDGSVGRYATHSGIHRAGPVTLASATKTFEDTHYRTAKIKAPLSAVVLPLGANYRLFDQQSKAFISQFDKPLTIAHLVRIHIPGSLLGTVLPAVDHPPTIPDVPSSYQCVASRPRCPHNQSVHEFEAHQRLLSSKATRWLTMVVELGCSNINFGKGDSMLILCHLAQEAGPCEHRDDSTVDNGLGLYHHIFGDDSFVERLLVEISKRLASIKDNWRETNLMLLLITLLLRIEGLTGRGQHHVSVLSLLETARLSTLAWVDSLRSEMVSTTDSETLKRASSYGFRAALLCRRTFELYERNEALQMPGKDLEVYIRASIAIQQNISSDADTLDAIDRACLKRDSVLAFHITDRVCAAMKAFPENLSAGILCGAGLKGPESSSGVPSPLRFEPWTFLTGDSKGWAISWLSDQGNSNWGAQRQCYAFHCAQGHLLLDGKTMGKLPDNIRSSQEFTELFGDKHMLTYPSSMPGMSHRLLSVINNNIVHLGQYGDKTIVLSVHRDGSTFEFVPRHHFIANSPAHHLTDTAAYDLPRRLVDDCVHWVNRSKQTLEIRKRETPWYTKDSDWNLNIKQRKARRRNVYLVDPFSQTCKLLRTVFQGFEDVQRLTVFQPIAARGALSAELRHLELSFEVTPNGILLCKELVAEVDPNQDAGTLYGYESMIVMRDAIEKDRQSIILPLSQIKWQRKGCHISVAAITNTHSPGISSSSAPQSNAGKAYARFEIDMILGRLTCPPEPRILFTKAMLHAFTSTPVPDPLTGRTGEEEAVHTLLSGRCQPWKSLPSICHEILNQILMLVPSRQYYPRDMRVLQKASWSEFLPIGMQSDCYGRIVRSIITQADALRQFEESGPTGSNPVAAPASSREVQATQQVSRAENDWEAELEARGEVQKMRYECAREDLEPECPVAPIESDYISLGRVHVSPAFDITSDVKCKASLAFQIGRMLHTQAKPIAMKQNISAILNRWTSIGGFCEGDFDPSLPILSKYMENRFLGETWGSLVEMCRNCTRADLPRIAFTLCSLSFAPGASADALRLLAAYCYIEKIKSIKTPDHDMYSGFTYNEQLTIKNVMDVIEGEYVEYVPEDIDETGWKDVQRVLRERLDEHARECHRQGQKLARELVSQWPSDLFPKTFFTSDYINGEAALSKVEGLWERLSHNRDLSQYISEVQEELDEYIVSPVKLISTENVLATAKRRERYSIPSISFILANCGIFSAYRDSTSIYPKMKVISPAPGVYRPPPEFQELTDIVQKFSQSDNDIRRQYGTDLAKSLQALNSVHKSQLQAGDAGVRQLTVQTVDAQAKSAYTAHSGRLQRTISISLSENSIYQHSAPWLALSGLWPRFTPVSVLELLRPEKGLLRGVGAFQCILQYGILVAETQRLYRLRRAIAKLDARRTKEELENAGHTNWHPADHPEWLLMELDANMLIREEQLTVAKAMIQPASQSNSVFQLNMGKGKTSVILPMVLAVIADGDHLARMIVPKSLILPTAQVILTRLGGLVGRQVRHLSFSRRLIAADNTHDLLSSYMSQHMNLVASRSMLIASPEHILAFKLCGLQSIADGKTDLGMDMVSFQTNLDQTLCRDVLDESDFTLAVRTQLVYPSGDLTTIDGAPHRWQIVQNLLSLIQDHAIALSVKFPNSVKVIPQNVGGYPTIHILNSDVEDLLHGFLVDDVCRGIIPLFRPGFERISSAEARTPAQGHDKKDIRNLLKSCLTEDVKNDYITHTASLFSDAKAVRNGILLVRGLIKHSILMTCLKKRWNVQYGLHPARWPIAVPFEAKGVPSDRSEFGHPDVSIIFTCLAFYYSGVDLEQFHKSLEHVLHHVDDPATEYERWSSGDGHTAIPPELQNWNSINVDDQGQVEKLWGHLRHSRSVINHYLNKFVFPQHSRQFSVKLQASAWDLPLITHFQTGDKSISKARTTGFSGTNDNKSLLPLTIKQDDLPGFAHTNAEVSAYFLQPRNREYVCTTNGPDRWTEKEFVSSLKNKKIRVLIDAGAFILELSNETLARNWLRVAEPDVKAAVFFDEKDNRAMVVFREATAAKVPLVSSPYADNLEECVVYFDEAHTRGVDLQLPPNAIGAVTLALGQTRDHTAQAALRLRQLATTQSVVFYAPPEVDQSIRDLCREHRGFEPQSIQSPHVVTWLLEQTCRANEQLSSLYSAHGRDFCQRTDAIWTHRNNLGDSESRDAMLKAIEQPERQTLETMYGTDQSTLSKKRTAIANTQVQDYMGLLQLVHSSQDDSGNFGTVQGAFEEVEQEREVEVQVEEEDIPERQLTYAAHSFPGVAESIREFVKTGSVASGSHGCMEAFSSMCSTKLGQRYGIRASAHKLYISEEFGRTIKPPKKHLQPRDDFLRPTEWLLWCPATETGMVVIMEELEELLPLVRQSKIVHLIAYAAAVTRSMLDFSSLKFLSHPPLPSAYKFPAWLPVEMGILAGRLYMRYSEAQDMIRYLEACVGRGESQSSVAAGSGATATTGFCDDPSSFLLEWLPLQRTSQDILHTPAAYICQGRPLTENHAFFLEAGKVPISGDVNGSNDSAPNDSPRSNHRSSGNTTVSNGDES